MLEAPKMLLKEIEKTVMECKIGERSRAWKTTRTETVNGEEQIFICAAKNLGGVKLTL